MVLQLRAYVTLSRVECGAAGSDNSCHGAAGLPGATTWGALARIVTLSPSCGIKYQLGIGASGYTRIGMLMTGVRVSRRPA